MEDADLPPLVDEAAGDEERPRRRAHGHNHGDGGDGEVEEQLEEIDEDGEEENDRVMDPLIRLLLRENVIQDLNALMAGRGAPHAIQLMRQAVRRDAVEQEDRPPTPPTVLNAVTMTSAPGEAVTLTLHRSKERLDTLASLEFDGKVMGVSIDESDNTVVHLGEKRMVYLESGALDGARPAEKAAFGHCLELSRYNRLTTLRGSGNAPNADRTILNPANACFTPSGICAVVDSERSVITVTRARVDGLGAAPVRFGRPGVQRGQFKFAWGVVVDESRERVWVSDPRLHRVTVFSATTGEWVMTLGREGNLPGCFRGPRGMDIDDLGNVWIADEENRRVQIFEPERGAVVGVLTFSGLNQAWDVAISASRVAIADCDARRLHLLPSPTSKWTPAVHAMFPAALRDQTRALLHLARYHASWQPLPNDVLLYLISVVADGHRRALRPAPQSTRQMLFKPDGKGAGVGGSGGGSGEKDSDSSDEDHQGASDSDGPADGEGGDDAMSHNGDGEGEGEGEDHATAEEGEGGAEPMDANATDAATIGGTEYEEHDEQQEEVLSEAPATPPEAPPPFLPEGDEGVDTPTVATGVKNLNHNHDALLWR